MNVVVTGGAGYIGSHVCKELKRNNFNPIVIDNLSDGNKNFVKWGKLEILNIVSFRKVSKILKKYKPIGVIHLAGKISVAESFKNPKKYYLNNLKGSNNILECMINNKIKKIVFSSSASVYGKVKNKKIKESQQYKPISPYARTKVLFEKNLKKHAKLNNIDFVSLRYFNVAGNDKKNEIGECHNPETHLIPLAIKAALEKKELKIYGNNYETKDGTCIRDYIHVSDLARAHVLALKKILKVKSAKFINLGNGEGFSNLDIINKIEKILKLKINKRFVKKRKGDADKLISDITEAKKYLKWSPKLSNLNTILRTAIAWQKKLVQNIN